MSDNFYNDFGDGFDDDDDDDDDEDEDEYADLDVSSFRSLMENIMGEESSEDEDDSSISDSDDDFASVDELISFATASASESTSTTTPVTDWAKNLLPEDSSDQISSILQGGVVLVANPAKFCSDWDDNNRSISPALLSKFGLTIPPPAELGPDRRADLLPVVVLLERQTLRGCQGLLMNRRTGYLIGDLEQEQPPKAPLPNDFEDSNADSDDSTTSTTESSSDDAPRLWAFMIQPLWFGGTSPGDAGGLNMIHPCDATLMPDGKALQQCEGLYWGGSPPTAQILMERGQVNLPLKGMVDDETGQERTRPLSGFDFKFFVQSTRWLPTQLEKEIRDETWFVAQVSKEVLFKSRDRLGAKRAKPLWTEIMDLMGGRYREIKERLYNE